MSQKNKIKFQNQRLIDEKYCIPTRAEMIMGKSLLCEVFFMDGSSVKLDVLRDCRGREDIKYYPVER